MLPPITRYLGIHLLPWSVIAILFALQAYVVTSYRGTPQAWWPSAGYSFAIFSVWAILSPAIVALVRKARERLGKGWQLALVCIAGLPVVSGLHALIFALLYWPLYNDNGSIPTRWAMAERMALPNLDTNTLFYVIVVSAALLWDAWSRRQTVASPAIAEAVDTPTYLQFLHARTRGRVQRISTDQVDWIAAADDYAEIHAAGATHLIETTLSELERKLPPEQFARIHRSTLVRVDRIVEVRSLGRGDALVRLSDASELRLSRRYRANLVRLLSQNTAHDPA